MSYLPSVSDKAAFKQALQNYLPPTASTFETIARAYVAESEALRRRFLLVLANIEQDAEIPKNPLFNVFNNPSKKQNFRKLAETLLLYQHLLADVSQTDAIQQAWLHYVINTDGAILIEDQSEENEEKDKQVFEWAERYAAMFNIRLEDDKKNNMTKMHYDGKTVRCSKWGKLKGLSVEYSLREVGQAINGNRYGYKDVIQSNLFNFTADVTAHDKINAMYLADLSSLAYRSERYVRVEAQRLGFDMIAWIENIKTDTQGFIAKGHGALVMVFRGTSQPKDWLTDLKASSEPFMFNNTEHGQVHAGFKQAIESVWDAIIETMMLPEAHELPIFITGHSLGGALAKLAAIKLLDDTNKTPTVYTFGAPRVGKNRFVQLYNEHLGEQTYLHVNNKDLIPHGIPFTLGYKHVGNVIRQFDKQHEMNLIAPKLWGVQRIFANLLTTDNESDFLLETLENAYTYVYDNDITPKDAESMGGYAGTVDDSRPGYIDDHQITEYMFKLACSHMDELFIAIERGE